MPSSLSSPRASSLRVASLALKGKCPFIHFAALGLKVEGSPLNPLLSNSFDGMAVCVLLQLFSHRSELKGRVSNLEQTAGKRKKIHTVKGQKREGDGCGGGFFTFSIRALCADFAINLALS